MHFYMIIDILVSLYMWFCLWSAILLVIEQLGRPGGLGPGGAEHLKLENLQHSKVSQDKIIFSYHGINSC